MVAIEVMAEISLESSPNRGCQGSTEGSSKDWRTVATVWVFLMMNPRSGFALEAMRQYYWAIGKRLDTNLGTER